MAGGYFIHWLLISPREAMTTAESPEPLIFQHSEFFLFRGNFKSLIFSWKT
jgi:hypothetical protein